MSKRRITILTTALAVMLVLSLVPVSALAAEGDSYTSDGFTFTELADGTLEVTYASGVGDVVIPSSYNGMAVTVIGERAFCCRHALESVTIPASVTSIGEAAFKWCRELTSVTIAKNSKLETIGKDAFIEVGISSMTIPSSVKTIGSFAFSGCPLDSLTFEENSSLTEIGCSAFSGSFSSVKIPASVTIIGSNAFEGCTHLASVTFAENGQLKTIGCSAFKDTAIRSVTIPKSVGIIVSHAFEDCSALTKAVILGSDTSVCTDAFTRSPMTDGIYGYKGSSAENCANYNGIPFHEVYVEKLVNGKLRRMYYNAAGDINRIEEYYGANESSGLKKISYYKKGVRTSYKLYNTSGKLTNLVELYRSGKTKKVSYYSTSTGKRTAYKLYDTAGRMTNYVYTYSDGVKPMKMNYYDVSTGKRYAYKLYNSGGEMTNYVYLYSDGTTPKKMDYYNPYKEYAKSKRYKYKLYDTAGRMTHYAQCYYDGMVEKMNYYNAATGIRTAYKTYREDGSVICWMKCDSKGKPTVATYYDENGKQTKVVRY